MNEDIDFGGGLGEGEEAGAHAGLNIGAEIGFGELVDGGAEIDHGDAFIDDECFKLVELEEVGGVDGVGAIDAAWGDDTDGGFWDCMTRIWTELVWLRNMKGARHSDGRDRSCRGDRVPGGFWEC